MVCVNCGRVTPILTDTSKAIFDCCHSATLLGVYFHIVHLFFGPLSVGFVCLSVMIALRRSHVYLPNVSLVPPLFLTPYLANVYPTDLKHHRCHRIGTWASRCEYPPPPSHRLPISLNLFSSSPPLLFLHCNFPSLPSFSHADVRNMM